MTTTRLTYTVEEASGVLGISISCAYDCIKRGQLPALRLGRRIVIPAAALDELLTSSGPFFPATKPITPNERPH